MASPKSTQELLDKYWATETTPEEEAQLRAAFDQNDKSTFAVYFRYLQAEAAKEMSSPLNPVRQSSRVIGMKRAISIAASVLVLVVAGFLIQRSMITEAQQGTADSFEDPMEAYEETKQALLMISEKFNSSRELAEEKLSKTQPYIDILK
jgi:hypothetical protein